MTEKNKLTWILKAIIDGDSPPTHQLPGGLRIIYRLPDLTMPRHRLLICRVNSTPSLTEFNTVRKNLEEALPGREIALGEPEEYSGTDNRPIYGRVFSWSAEAKQIGLFDQK